MGSTTMEVADWGDLDRLVRAMDEVGGQMAQATSYAVTWMCRPDGFATSPVCLLRPLGEVLERVGEAFTEAGRVWGDDWRRLHDATVDAAQGLRASDGRAHQRAEALARTVEAPGPDQPEA